MSVIKTADGSHTRLSERYGETFHSTHGAMTEARHVYLDATGVRQRLETHQPTRILEIGFGLGLNALLSADLAKEHGTALEYHAIEHDRSVCEHIGRLEYDRLLKHPELLPALLQCIECREPESHLPAGHATHRLRPSARLAENDSQGEAAAPDTEAASRSARTSQSEQTTVTLATDIHLTLHWCNAIDIELPEQSFHAIYLDAFSPDCNPECWTTSFLQKLHSLLIPDIGQLSTYSAKGAVRRALLEAGFCVTKLPGPPGKREFMVATALSGNNPHSS